MKELAVVLCQTDKDLANGILSQMQQCTETRKAAIQGYLQVCDQIVENCKEVESVTVIGYSRTLNALESQLTREEISEEERESITLSVMGEMKKYDEENKTFYREVLDKIAVGLLACADGISHNGDSKQQARQIEPIPTERAFPCAGPAVSQDVIHRCKRIDCRHVILLLISPDYNHPSAHFP